MENNLINNTWDYIPPCEDSYEIRFFDDGNQQFLKYNNTWVKFGKWKGKVAIYNRREPEIIIKSISSWKIKKVN